MGDKDGWLSALASARRHVLAQLDGLTEDQLRAASVPSGWSPIGLVRHLTLSDERYWFEVVVAGGPLDFWPAGENGDWQVGPEEPVGQVIDDYRAAIEASDAIIAATDLDAPPRSPEKWWAEAGMTFPDLRSVLRHVTLETATHAGQLDVARELIDGRQFIVL